MIAASVPDLRRQCMRYFWLLRGDAAIVEDDLGYSVRHDRLATKLQRTSLPRGHRTSAADRVDRLHGFIPKATDTPKARLLESQGLWTGTSTSRTHTDATPGLHQSPWDGYSRLTATRAPATTLRQRVRSPDTPEIGRAAVCATPEENAHCFRNLWCRSRVECV